MQSQPQTLSHSNSTNAAAPIHPALHSGAPSGASIHKDAGAGAPTGNSNYASADVFGRKKSWSDQAADNHLLQAGGKNSTGLNGTYHHPSTHGNDVKFVNSTMEILQDQIKREEAPKKKRTRTTIEQLRILQRAFITDPMPNSSARVALAKRLGMTARAVQVWFQNRRAKEKLDAKRVEMGVQGNSAFMRSRNQSYDDDEELEDYDGQSYDSSEDIEPQSQDLPPVGPHSGFPASRPVRSQLGTHTSTTASGSHINSSLLTSLKANGMLSRLAFDSASKTLNATAPTSTLQGHNYPNPPQLPGYFPASSFPKAPSPGPFLMEGMHDPSVDQLYHDLGTSGGLISPPTMAFNQHAQGSQRQFAPNGSAASAYAMFAFGEPFFAAGGDGQMGGVDRAPSVSPVGFMMLGNSASAIGGSGSTGNRAYSLPVTSPFDMLPTYANPLIDPPMSPVNTVLSSSAASSLSTSSSSSDFSTAYRLPTCGNVCLSSTVLTGTNGSSPTNISTVNASTANTSSRRSFSLPEAHSNLTNQQLQHLESFGLQIFPSPLMSIHEEDTGTMLSGTVGSFDPTILDASVKIAESSTGAPLSTSGPTTLTSNKNRRMSEGSLVAASIDANNLMAFSEFLENGPLSTSNNSNSFISR